MSLRRFTGAVGKISKFSVINSSLWNVKRLAMPLSRLLLRLRWNRAQSRNAYKRYNIRLGFLNANVSVDAFFRNMKHNQYHEPSVTKWFLRADKNLSDKRSWFIKRISSIFFFFLHNSFHFLLSIFPKNGKFCKNIPEIPIGDIFKRINSEMKIFCATKILYFAFK